MRDMVENIYPEALEARQASSRKERATLSLHRAILLEQDTDSATAYALYQVSV